MAEKAPKKILIKWVKSTNGRLGRHKRTIRALGFTKLQSEVIKEATPQVMGMVNQVQHLVEVKEAPSS